MSNEELFDGLIITGTPSEISRWIAKAIAAGFAFEPHYDPLYVGDAIVIKAKNASNQSQGSLNPEPAPAPVVEVTEPEPTAADLVVETVEDVVEAVKEAVDSVAEEVIAEVTETTEAEAEKPAPKRGRKPKVVTEEVVTEVEEG